MPIDAPDWLQRVIEQLAAAQVRSEDRFAVVETQLDRLAAVQERTAALLTQHDARLGRIEARLDRQDDRLGALTGWTMEARFAGRAASLLTQLGVRHVEVFYPAQLLERELNVALKESRITEAAAAELRLADLVCRARDRATDEPVAIVVEVSARVASHDVERAADRAQLAAPLAGRGVAVVVGERLDEDARVLAKERGVTWLRMTAV